MNIVWCLNFARVQHELSFKKFCYFLALLKIHITITIIIHFPTMNNLCCNKWKKITNWTMFFAFSLATLSTNCALIIMGSKCFFNSWHAYTLWNNMGSFFSYKTPYFYYPFQNLHIYRTNPIYKQIICSSLLLQYKSYTWQCTSFHLSLYITQPIGFLLSICLGIVLWHHSFIFLLSMVWANSF